MRCVVELKWHQEKMFDHKYCEEIYDHCTLVSANFTRNEHWRYAQQ